METRGWGWVRGLLASMEEGGGGERKNPNPTVQVWREKYENLSVLKSTSRRKTVARPPAVGHTGKEKQPFPLSQRKRAQFELE